MKTTRQYESKKLKFLSVKSVQSEGGADCVTLSTPPCTARLERQIHEWNIPQRLGLTYMIIVSFNTDRIPHLDLLFSDSISSSNLREFWEDGRRAGRWEMSVRANICIK